MKNNNKSVCLIHFGCAKNLVESEHILAWIADHPALSLIGDYAVADIVVFNTCAFLASARQEVLEKVLEVASVNPSCQRILYGCFASLLSNTDEQWDEYNAMASEITGSARNLTELADLLVPQYSFSCTGSRMLQSTPGSAYVRLGDGCSNHCAYCLIPVIKGEHVSDSVEEILSQIRLLKHQRVQEFNLISQDTAFYGGVSSTGLISLLEKISPELSQEDWVRCLYLHPVHITSELIEYIVSHKNVLNYLDLPVQHVADPMLVRQNRHIDRKSIYKLFDSIYAADPEFMIRTTLMLGMPGETEEDYQALKDFVRRYPNMYVGFFIYSPEKGTKSFAWRDECPPVELSDQRCQELFYIQKENMLQLHQRYLEREIKVLCEECADPDQNLWVCRASFQAPEVDTCTLVQGDLQAGNFYKVRITQVDEFELKGELCSGLE